MEVSHPDLECRSKVIGSYVRHLKKSGGASAFTPASLTRSHFVSISLQVSLSASGRWSPFSWNANWVVTCSGECTASLESYDTMTP